MKVLQVALIYFIGIYFISCNKLFEKRLSPKDYIRWFKENSTDFIHEKTISDYRFKWIVMPAEYKILTEVENVERLDSDYFEMRDSALHDYLSCSLIIYPIDNQKSLLESEKISASEFGGRLNYFLNYAQNDIYLLQGLDTFKCLSYHFENTYGLQKFNTIDLIFEYPKKIGQDLVFIFDEKVLDVGTIKFTQNIEKLKGVPLVRKK